MADLAQLEAALVKADAAGDSDGARILAGEVRKMRGAAQVPSGLNSASDRISRYTQQNAQPWQDAASEIDAAPYNVGAAVNDKAAKYVSPEIAAGLGTAANFATSLVPMAIGGAVGGMAQPAAMNAGRSLMQKALRPPLGELEKGKAQRAAETMLQQGYSPTRGAVDEMGARATALNQQVRGITDNSTRTGNADRIIDSLGQVEGQIGAGTLRAEGLRSVDRVRQEFNAHPAVLRPAERQAELAAALADRQRSMASALQDAGRYRTMAAQQENLANGGGVNLARGGTPLNEPYMNVGSETLGGGRSLSPSAYPVQSGMVGNPRTPGQYTHNIERVPEANSAAADAMRIYWDRRAEVAGAAQALREYNAAGGARGVPIRDLQAMKQENYRQLGDASYGAGLRPMAERDALKGVTGGIRREIESVHPEVAPLNAAASELLNARRIAERRVLMSGNNNPLPLGASVASAVHNPAAALGLWANSSDLVKSMLARALYSGQIPANAGRGAGLAYALQQDQEARQ